MTAPVIDTAFDDFLNAFIVRFPEYITLTALEVWAQAFRAKLQQRNTPKGIGLLLDTNRHHFESIACLQFIRSFLQQICRMEDGVYRVAFVQPIQYRIPEVVSGQEAYFSTLEQAEAWLRG